MHWYEVAGDVRQYAGVTGSIRGLTAAPMLSLMLSNQQAEGIALRSLSISGQTLWLTNHFVTARRCPPTTCP